MKKTNALIERLEPCVGRDIYVWGGQWHKVPSEKWICDKETSASNGERAVKLYRKRLKTYKPEDILGSDCSGLITEAMIQEGILPYDTTANGLKNRCRMIEKTQLKKGCLVFRVYKTGSKKGQAYHVGIVCDDALNVIESKGRDDGVVKRTLNASGSGYWNAFGVYNKLEDEYKANEPAVSDVVISRILKSQKKNGKYVYRGEDVRAVQQRLHENGYSPGSIDGVYGPNTKNAVLAFQKAKKCTPYDGIVGKKTTAALGLKWGG